MKMDAIAQMEEAIRVVGIAVRKMDEAKQMLIASGESEDVADAYLTASKQAVIDIIAGQDVMH